jgi:aminomethyltransferase
MNQTVLHDIHVASGARMVDFAGWNMPVQYRDGILAEHLATRRRAGLFDVSHMGRFEVLGAGAVPFLRRVLTNDAALLQPGESQYTLLPTASGGARDDAYLYRFQADRFLLVVNASNRGRDWEHLQREATAAGGQVTLTDLTAATAMLSVQGPASAALLGPHLGGQLPASRRNACGLAQVADATAWVGRTGYTGEPLGFEVILPAAAAGALWTALVAAGAEPVGLGARDTLRLEAALPLYGHELGTAADGAEIPILACPAARFGVALGEARGDFVGRDALVAQAAALVALRTGGPGNPCVLPRRIRCLAIADQGIARAGAEARIGDRQVGVVTSGTMVPYWRFSQGRPGDRTDRRALALALLDASLVPGDSVRLRVRDRDLVATVVERFVDTRSGPYAVPVLP